jgi:hypothetical protein
MVNVVPTATILRLHAQALGHAVDDARGDWLECSRPGCNMGASAEIDEHGTTVLRGSAVTFKCCGEFNA